MPATSNPPKREALDSAITAQVSENLAQWMAAIEVGVAIGTDHEQTHGFRRTHDVTQKKQRRLLCPVQIIEDEKHRSPRRQRRKPCGDSIEEAIALGFGIRLQRRIGRGNLLGEDGDQTRHLAGIPAEHREVGV